MPVSKMVSQTLSHVVYYISLCPWKTPLNDGNLTRSSKKKRKAIFCAEYHFIQKAYINFDDKQIY